MSNNTPEISSQDDSPTWNISQLLKIVGVVGLTVSAVLVCSEFQNKGKVKDSHSQQGIINAFIDKNEYFRGLPITQIGNPEEMHTLRSGGKDGWYVFQEGNTITYWKIETGVIESNTYTLTQ